MTEHTFIQPPALARMSRKLKEPSEEAITFLQEAMKNTELDVKYRMQAAQFLVDKGLQSSDSAGKESIMRLMQEIKRTEAKRSLEGPKEAQARVVVTNQIVGNYGENTDGHVDVGNLNKL